MWSFPVTLGGGMTMTYRGEPAGPEGRKRPSSSQSRYHRSSKEEGSKVFGSFLGFSSEAAGIRFSDIKKRGGGPRAPLKISETASGFTRRRSPAPRSAA